MTTTNYMTLREVATLLHKEYQTVWRWAREGKFPTRKVAGSILVPRGEFEQWVESQTTHG